MKVRLDGDVVGRIQKKDGEKRYITEREEDGFVEKHNGFAIARELFENTPDTPNLVEEVDLIEVHFTRSNGKQFEYHARPQYWKRHGIQDQLGDYEEQVFLTVSDFEDVKVVDGVGVHG